MLKKLIIPALAVLSISACSMKAYTRVDAPLLFSALDTQPNGYKGSIGADAIFEITTTKTNQTLLCRDVKIASLDGTSKRQYCKIKGGDWR